ncbi:hypothetical protein [Streptomyces sp. NPDC088725]|uniref:hypothetical protein n=1 Tax=Streptomyces sp. NPDC088725 TaxID=3365873 RepID=UPI0037F51D6E
MSITRRLLLTATAAGTLLCGLSFVPSAHADGVRGATHQETSESAQPADDSASLTGTGGVNTTPYLNGGTPVRGLGAGLVAHAVHVAHAAHRDAQAL